MIWLIALIPAVIVFFIAVGSESKGKTLVAAAIAAAVGVLTGNPAYTLLDVGAVLVALVLAWRTFHFKTRPMARAQTVEPKPAVEKAENNDGGPVLLWILIVGAVGIWLFGGDKRSPKPPIAPNQATVRPAPYSPPIQVSTSGLRPTEVASPVKKAQLRKSPVQKCLEIPSESDMQDCLSRLK